MKTNKTILLPVYDSAKSFYNKAKIKTIEQDGQKIILLYSYNSIIASVSSPCKSVLLNKYIIDKNLMTATTLRHLKEFLRQFYENKSYTKKQILKEFYQIYFDFLLVHETNNSTTVTIADRDHLDRATSPDTKKWFKKMFKGHSEKTYTDKTGTHIRASFGDSWAKHDYYFLKNWED